MKYFSRKWDQHTYISVSFTWFLTIVLFFWRCTHRMLTDSSVKEVLIQIFLSRNHCDGYIASHWRFISFDPLKNYSINFRILLKVCGSKAFPSSILSTATKGYKIQRYLRKIIYSTYGYHLFSVMHQHT